MLASLLVTVLAAAADGKPVQAESDCMVLLLRPEEALTRLDVSTTSGDFKQCHWPLPGIPLGYRLTRAAYTVQFRVFQNSSGGIALAAIDAAGNPVRLRGERFLDAVEMHIPLAFDGTDYRYWVLSNWLDSRPIEFEVIDTNDLVLGRERLAYSELHSSQANP